MGFVNGKGEKISVSKDVSNDVIKTVQTYNLIGGDDIYYSKSINQNTGLEISSDTSCCCNAEFVPVTVGNVLVSRFAVRDWFFYDEDKKLVSKVVGRTSQHGYCSEIVPENAVYMRLNCRMKNSAEAWGADYVVKDVDSLLVYVSTALYPRGDVRPWIPSTQINGLYVSEDFYDSTLPEKESEFNRVMRCKTIKTVNRMKGIMRVGSFNTQGVGGKLNSNLSVVKKELMDFGLNMCGFQEIFTQKDSEGNPEISFIEYMKSFQFPYGDTIATSDTGKRLLSDCEVLESVEVVYTNNLANGNAYLHNIVKLPNHGNVRNFDKTASVYVAHFTVAADIKLAEVAELCTAIQADASEYKILIADTNGFGGATEENPYSNVWQMLIEAGMNPAITDTTRPTVTVPDAEFELNNLDCIDNVFFTSNIKCVNWDIIDSNNYLLDDGSVVSDHCMVFADLIFDYMPEFEKV